jgi:hypothetical protein
VPAVFDPLIDAATHIEQPKGIWLQAAGLDRLIGGWEVAGIFSFASGAPLSLPTNSAFYKSGCNPSLGSAKTDQKWFDTSCFVAFPTKETTYDELHDTSKFPSWTGVQDLPGYN